MNNSLAQKAIDNALQGKWDEAVDINEKILQEFPDDIDTLNRLAKAYSESGKLKKAKTIAKKVIKIDPYNKIANRCLEKWNSLSDSDASGQKKVISDVFIEEPGKTRLVKLNNVSSRKALAALDCGDEVKLNLHGHRLSVIGDDGKYIGRIPDNIGSRLKKLISIGKEYRVFVKSQEKDEIQVFIKETNSSEKAKDIPSFPNEKIEYVSFTSPDLVHNKKEVEANFVHEEE